MSVAFWPGADRNHRYRASDASGHAARRRRADRIDIAHRVGADRDVVVGSDLRAAHHASGRAVVDQNDIGHRADAEATQANAQAAHLVFHPGAVAGADVHILAGAAVAGVGVDLDAAANFRFRAALDHHHVDCASDADAARRRCGVSVILLLKSGGGVNVSSPVCIEIAFTTDSSRGVLLGNGHRRRDANACDTTDRQRAGFQVDVGIGGGFHLQIAF